MSTHTSGIRHDVAELTERLGTGVEQLSASLLQYSHVVALYRVDINIWLDCDARLQTAV